MPELREMARALRGATDQSLHGFVDGSSGCQGTGLASRAVRLSVAASLSCCSRALPTRNFGDQVTDLSRFPQMKSLFQLGVPVDTFRDSSKEQATTEAAEQKPKTGDRSSLLRDSLPTPWRRERPRTAGVPSPSPGGARRAAACQTDVTDGAVRKRAVVQRFSWGYWLRALRKLLTGCRTAGRSVLPRLSWKVSPMRSSRRGVSLPLQWHLRHPL